MLHKEVKSFFDLTTQRWDALRQLRTRRLDGDPRLVEQAVAFGDCLVAKGYRVTSRKPTDLAQRGSRTFGAQLKRLNQGKREPTAKQARPYLIREIEDALDDLACGKDFYARHSPADAAIIEEIDAEFGM